MLSLASVKIVVFFRLIIKKTSYKIDSESKRNVTQVNQPHTIWSQKQQHEWCRLSSSLRQSYQRLITVCVIPHARVYRSPKDNFKLFQRQLNGRMEGFDSSTGFKIIRDECSDMPICIPTHRIRRHISNYFVEAMTLRIFKIADRSIISYRYRLHKKSLPSASVVSQYKVQTASFSQVYRFKVNHHFVGFVLFFASRLQVPRTSSILQLLRSVNWSRILCAGTRPTVRLNPEICSATIRCSTRWLVHPTKRWLQMTSVCESVVIDLKSVSVHSHGW